MPLRVAVVEDDARYRSSLEQLFTNAPGFSLAASYPSAVGAVREAEETIGHDGVLPWDLVVMDIE